jgi:hypothetical protein
VRCEGASALSLDPYLASLRAEKPDAPRFAAQQRMFSSGAHLVRHMQDVPVLSLACVEGRIEKAGPGAQASLYGSIFPAVWSLMLAFRARWIGTVMTTQHIEHFEQDMATAVGLPEDMTQVALLAVAYFTGSDFLSPRMRPLGTMADKRGGQPNGRFGTLPPPTIAVSRRTRHPGPAVAIGIRSIGRRVLSAEERLVCLQPIARVDCPCHSAKAHGLHLQGPCCGAQYHLS